MKNAIDLITGNDPSEVIKREINDTLEQLESIEKDTDDLKEELKSIRDRIDDEDVSMFDVAQELGDLKEMKEDIEEL